MDFRDWKKVSEDGKTCTLQHPKGHKLTVALKGLSSIHREQLKRLKLSKGGVAHYDEGTPKAPVSEDDASTTTEKPDGGTNITINAAPAAGATPPAQALPSMTQTTSPAADLAKQPVQAVPPEPVQGEENVLPNGQTNPGAVNRNVQLAAKAQGDIDAAKAKAEGQNVNDYTQALGQLEQHRQEAYNDMAKHVQDFSDYQNQHPIDPKHYQENMGSTEKTTKAIGLFLGGLGVPFGGHNYAFDFLNKQIDRDIEAQKAKADQQKTIYGAYRDLYGDGQQAYAATKASMLDILNKKQELVAKQVGTPQAAQKSLALRNQLAIEAQKGLKDSAAQIGALPGTTSNQPKSGAKGPQAPAPAEGGSKKYEILSPKAQGTFNNIMQGYSTWSPEKDKIAQQYTAAQQAERVLNGPNNDGKGGVDELMDTMYKSINAGPGGAKGLEPHVRESIQKMEDIPYAGPLVKGLNEIVPKGDAYKNFEISKNQLESDLATALSGLVTPTEIHNMIEKNLPALGDDDKNVSSKTQAIVNMVKKAVRGSMLEGPGLLKKQQ